MPLNKVNYVDGQTIISAQNMNDIQDEIIRLGEKEAIQSDWNQNDETALDFIKNRTHWSNRLEGEFFNGLFENNDGTWVFLAENAILPMLNCDEKYQVIIEDQVFESSLNSLEELVQEEEFITTAYVFGDCSLVFPDIAESTGEPFILLLAEQVEDDVHSVGGMLVLLDDIPRQADGYRVKISGEFINSIKKLDEIYMPESYNVAKTVLSNLMDQMSEVQNDISTNETAIGRLQLDVLNVLKSTTQNLTEAQKAQARKNIGAIGIDEGIQADLSETDESSLAFVKGVLRRDSVPGYVPMLAEIVSYIGNKVECLCGQWVSTSFFDKPAMGSSLQIENINQLQAMDSENLCIQFNNKPGSYYPLYHSSDLDGTYWINEDRTIMLLRLVNTYMIVVFGEEQPSFSSIALAEANWQYSKRLQCLHPALLPSAAVRRSELDSLKLITLEDIDFICAKRVKVTFPVHGLSIKISYTDAKGVFHENENLPEKSKTTYEVLKGTSIKLNGNYFDETSFVLPEDSKYYTKVSGSEIIPHMDFEIKYADGAPT